MTALILSALLLQAPDASVKFQSLELGLEFMHPKAWKLKRDKKGRTSGTFVTKQGATVQLDIFAATFGSEPDLWQKLQRDAARQLNRQVVRQSQEELLGVPLLITQTRGFEPSSGEYKTFSALLYNRSVKKLLVNFRVASPGYEDAELEVRTAFQSLHTLTGELPIPETPNRPLTAEELKPKKPTPIGQTTTFRDEVPKNQLRKAANVVPTTAGGKNVELRIPKGWSAKKDGDQFLLSLPDLPEPIRVSVLSTLDSDTPVVALVKLSGKTLTAFDSVTSREDQDIKANLAGASLNIVVRNGLAASKPLQSIEAFGALGDYYWLAERHPGKPLTKPQQEELFKLFKAMSVELAP